MPNTTYTPNPANFMDIAMTPANIANGTLVQRLSTKNYPKAGVKRIPDPIIASITPATGAQGATVNIVITGQRFDRGSNVTISGTGVTVSNVVRMQGGKKIKATLTITGGATASARNVTVTNSLGGTVTSNGAFTVTAP